LRKRIYENLLWHVGFNGYANVIWRFGKVS
jgi:hypothetical protein